MAWYRTGTIAITNGSTAVTGTGTAWILNASVGEAILAPDGKLYEIAAINSNTSIALASPYLGSTQSGQTYVVVPTQSYIRDLAAQAAALVNSYSSIANNAGQGKFGDGTAAAPGITFSADQDTGFFRSANNEVTFVANGVAQLKYSATGGITFMNNAVTINGTALVKTDDSRLTNSREWTASTVDQAEAEAGTATTRRAWTAQRVRQAIAAWWNSLTNIDGKNIGATTAGTGRFTTLSATGNTTLGDDSTDTVRVNGYMGIGTSSPLGRLDVRGAFGNFSTASSAESNFLCVPLFNSGLRSNKTWQKLVTLHPTSAVACGHIKIQLDVSGWVPSQGRASLEVIVSNRDALLVFGRVFGSRSTFDVEVFDNGDGSYSVYAAVGAGQYTAQCQVAMASVGYNSSVGAPVYDLFSTSTTTTQPSGTLVYTLSSDSATTHMKHNGSLGLGVDPGSTRLALKTTGTGSETVARFGNSNIEGALQVVTNGNLDWGLNALNSRNLVFMTNQTERLRITSTGVLDVISGQIKFPATQIASADANTLDDYKEGTFTPVVAGSTTAGVGTYTAQSGFYTKIGRMVYFNILVTWSAHTGTGHIKVTGLPFVSNGAANNASHLAVAASGLSFSNNLAANVGQGSSEISFVTYLSGTDGFGTVSMDSSAALRIAGHYFV